MGEIDTIKSREKIIIITVCKEILVIVVETVKVGLKSKEKVLTIKGKVAIIIIKVILKKVIIKVKVVENLLIKKVKGKEVLIIKKRVVIIEKVGKVGMRKRESSLKKKKVQKVKAKVKESKRK